MDVCGDKYGLLGSGDVDFGGYCRDLVSGVYPMAEWGVNVEALVQCGPKNGHCIGRGVY